MSSFSLDVLRVNLQHVGIDPDAVTWSSISSFAAFTLVSVFVLFRTSYRPGEPVSAKNLKAQKKTLTRAMQRIRDAVKPEDGTVRVAEILIHPIKSCRGISVQSCKYNLLGLENDREWCFVDVEKKTIITAREFPKIVLITPRIEEDPADAHGGSILVAFPPDAPQGCTAFRIPLHPSPSVLKTWEMCVLHHHPRVLTTPLYGFPGSRDDPSDPLDGYIGRTLPLSAPSRASTIASLYFGKPVHVVYKGPRPCPAWATALYPSLDASTVFQDAYPLLVMSRESMDELGEEVRARVAVDGMGVGEEWREGKVEIRRFRPNIVVEGAGPFAEDAWAELCFGSRDAPVVRLVSRCVRCLFPNISPETGERDKAVPFNVLMKFRTGLHFLERLRPCVGCNGVFTGSGVVNVGDVVYVNKLIPPSEALPIYMN